MPRIAILGAGFMGSALAVPAADNGHHVALWGTHLDGHLVSAVRARSAHPKLGLVLPDAVTPFDAAALPAALDGAELVINAVTSDAAVRVLERAARFIARATPVLSVSKGLVRRGGRVVTLSSAIRDASGVRIVTVAGPSKAMELARRVPTAVVYASPDARARGVARRWLETPYYRVEESSDQAGAEIASALKNAYAIAIGLCDGLVVAGIAEAMYNTKSLLYTQALAEMSRIARAVRARPETIAGLPGAGDLHVTAAAGRNRIFGELRGSGLPTAVVVERLKARDELTEGYAAVRWSWRFALERGVSEVPLLRALHRIVYRGRDVATEFRAAGLGAAVRTVTRSSGHRQPRKGDIS